MSMESMQERLIEELIRDIPLPAKPDILLRFMREKEADELDLDKFGKIISTDMSIALGILKAVNSAFFGITNEVRSVNHAISMLGLENVSNLVLGFSLQKSLESERSFVLNDFWEMNHTRALIAASIASTYTKIPGDLAYTLCLICDCGIPAIMRKEKSYEQFYADSMKGCNTDVIQLEEQVFMYNHAKVGSYLLREWMLPDVLIKAVKYHHHTNILALGVSHEVKTLIAIQQLASNVYSVHHNGQVDFCWKESMKDSLELLELKERSLLGIQNNFNLLLENM